MPYRPKDIYRGRRKFRVPLTIALFVIAALIVGAVVMFYALQQFLVYDQTGVSLQLPFMQSQTPAADEPSGEPEPTFEPVAVQVVYEDPDFSEVDLGGWQELRATKALFVPYEDVTSETKLASAISDASGGDFTGLVLELKDRSGQLAWVSQSETAVNYGTSGAMDYTETLAAIHEAGLTAAAQLSCCADDLMAKRNWLITLQTPSGGAYTDEDGVSWLDPYNRTVRNYIAELMAELTAMGFDEIILADLYHPVSETGFIYSVTLQTEADPVMAVCQMARRLVELEEGGATVSALIDADSLRNGMSSQTGQDIDIFWRIFARLYCPTSADMAASDLELAADAMNDGDAAVRFVPVSAVIPEGMGSYVVK